MFSIILVQFSLSVSGHSNRKYSYGFTDVDQNRKHVELVENVTTKVRIDGVESNIEKVTDLDYSLQIENHKNLLYTVVKQTITNKGSNEKKVDFCTAMLFKAEDKEVIAQTLANFGYSLWWKEITDLTLVLQNHPWVTDVNAHDFGSDDVPKFFTNTDK
ncbi:hypothetical protein TVAG_547420, partial [Trichomonas vaginalis G3]